MKAMADIDKAKSEITNSTMQTQADVALKMAQAKKAEQEAQAGPEGVNPADMLNAQAAMMSAENDRADMSIKQKQLEVENKDITIDGENRSAERDTREKLAMVNLQRDALQMDHEKEMQQNDMKKIALQAALKPEPAPKTPGKKKPKPGLAG